MRVAVLRVSGADFDPDAYVKRHGFTPDIIWRAGEPDRLGRVRSKSGFNLSIGDAVSAAALVKQVRGWVEDNMSALLALGGLGGVAVIDVGLTVGTSDPFTARVTLTPADLASPSGKGRRRVVGERLSGNGRDRIGAWHLTSRCSRRWPELNWKR